MIFYIHLPSSISAPMLAMIQNATNTISDPISRQIKGEVPLIKMFV